jgi:hypothetical protein
LQYESTSGASREALQQRDSREEISGIEFGVTAAVKSELPKDPFT